MAEKSKIRASFLRADVRDRVGLKIFDKCDSLQWYICCFLVKHLSTPIISILKTSVQREGQNNAAALNFLKPDSLRVDVFFGSAFAVDLAEVTKLFFEILLETSFFHLIIVVSTNSILFLTYFRYSINKSTHFLTIRNICSDLDKWILKEWIDWEQSSNYARVIFPKLSIVCRIIIMVISVIFVGTFGYFALHLLKIFGNFGSCDLLPSL